MGSIMGFLKDTIRGGVFFLIPFTVVLALVGKAMSLVHGITGPIAARIPVDALGGIPMPRLIAIVVLALICMLAGLFAKTAPGRAAVRWLESTLLIHIPGYAYMKSMGENMAGVEGAPSQTPVLARIEDSWQIGFIVDEIEPGQYAVFVPGAPSPWSGSLYVMAEERIRRLDLTIPQAQTCLERLGVGSGELLKGRLPRTVPS